MVSMPVDRKSAVMFANILIAQAGFIYRDMYDHPDNWPNMGELAREFDDNYNELSPHLATVYSITHDCVDSDRDAASFMLAYKQLKALTTTPFAKVAA
ncbi:hypothetical protein [Bifidobacterium platyrrhinorum]|uniref:Uncharacterized protein n=1 Tax=Bifidobacterium platyrrhinorum TaxID=2661628 RepID=A0A6L9SW77_9BIFI|nr:hypothetical protein [Bifidobacterium platyrrhinorum]NEG55451.1 hypothetical protein [Bifidobacterium platyrrhinorum]